MSEVAKIQSRFGELTYSMDQVITFPKGIIGFEDLTEFIVVPVKDGNNFNWLQSTQDPSIAFVVTDPTKFYMDYQVIPANEEVKRLAAKSKDELFVLSIATIEAGAAKVTLNLAAPILLNAEKQLAAQVVLENFSNMVKVPLQPVDNGPKEVHQAK